MDKIKEIWKRLDANPAVAAGVEKIRYSESAPCDVYLGKKIPENSRRLVLRISHTNGELLRGIKNLKGIRIEKVADEKKEGFILLNLILSENQYQDIFDILINDIISYIVQLTNETEIVKNFYNRLSKWQSLFEKYNPEGLSGENQRGLYGELVFLRKLIDKFSSKSSAVESWVGCIPAIQDFQLGKSAIEVKTTSGNNHQKVHISSERQLDETPIEELYLFHISLDVRAGNGETLNTIVEDIKMSLDDDDLALTIYRQKLMEGGYFESHKDLYADQGYTIRSAEYLKVQGGFPRLTEKDIPEGVGDVKYTINVSDCHEYSVSEQDVIYSISKWQK